MSLFRSRFSIRKFAADRRANVAAIFAISALVLIGFTGMGIDYYTALSAKVQLDLAADAASIETITTVSNYIKANPTMDVTTAFNNIKPTAVTQGTNAFTVNAGKTYTRMVATAPVPALTLGTDLQTISASVDYAAASPNAFGPLFRVKNINLSGTSSASLTLPKYLDFYMLLDMSGSMGFPSTVAGQTALAAINPDDLSQFPSGCIFACHIPGSQGYAMAAQANPPIQLRAAAVGEAIKDLITNAKITMQATGLSQQFRLGIYPFIKTMDVFYPLSTNLDGATTAINNLGTGGLSNLLDTGDPQQGATCTTSRKGVKTCTTPGYGSGGTDINVALNGTTVSGKHVNGIIDIIPAVGGNGSNANSPQPFVFLVTDGLQNGQTYPPFSGSTPSAVNPTWCNNVKKQAKIAILYITYENIPIHPKDSQTFKDEDTKVDNLIPSIPSTLVSCASPGFYFTATNADDINNAMVQMFYQAVDQVAHLTH